MQKKIFVSYLVAGIYFGSVFAISLLIALLASLSGVKRSNCDVVVRSIENIPNESLMSLDHQQAAKLEVVGETRSKGKRSVEAREKIRQIISKEGEMVNKRGFARANDDCPQFLIFQNGNYWENVRLPSYVRPTRYDLELSIPKFDSEKYVGIENITIQLDQDTQYIIFHSLSVEFNDGRLFDKNNVEIQIECGGYYQFNDYYVLILKNVVPAASSPLRLYIEFTGLLFQTEFGIFDIPYAGGQGSSVITTNFEPIDARQAFPCFDDPGLKAVWSITIDHPLDSIAVSNMPPISEATVSGTPITLRTKFADTPNLPTYMIALTIFHKNDFSSVTRVTAEGTTINLWAQNNFISNGFADAPLDLAINIFDAAEYYLYPLDGLANSGPKIINMIALPDYAVPATAPWGIPLFKETRLLFKNSTITEIGKQRIALLIAKQFAQFWAGNAVTFKWWDQLWLQSGLSDYLKYKFVDFAYEDWRVADQFITEELIEVLVQDAYPSAHPVVKVVDSVVEIEQLFDGVETAKVAALLRVVESEIGERLMWSAIGSYFKQFDGGNGDPEYLIAQFGNIRKWTAKEFLNRWFLQSNYPLLSISLEYNSVEQKQYLMVKQERNVNVQDSIFDLDVLYSSIYNYTWYVPLKCTFGVLIDGSPDVTLSGNGQNLVYKTFDIDTKMSSFVLDQSYTWVHCDEDFIGYYTLDYTEDNWGYLATLLYSPNSPFGAPDRANIVHNIFVNAYAEKERYSDLVNVLKYLRFENDLLPWRTVGKHLKDIVDIIQYRPSFQAVSEFFTFELRFYERNIDLWTPSDNHVDQITKQTILLLACRLQDFNCLKNSSSYWDDIYSNIGNPESSNSVPIHVRPVVYNYHFQNTYSIRDWDYTFLQYETTNDVQEEERLLQALTFTRLPSQLARFLESQRTGGLKNIDFLLAVYFFSENPLGRELMWTFYRANFNKLVEEFTLDTPALGIILLEISRTFEDEFLYHELSKFVFESDLSDASEMAAFKALEIVSTNVHWLKDNEEELEMAFRPRNSKKELSTDVKTKSKYEADQFTKRIRKQLSESKKFQDLKKRITKSI